MNPHELARLAPEPELLYPADFVDASEYIAPSPITAGSAGADSSVGEPATGRLLHPINS